MNPSSLKPAGFLLRLLASLNDTFIWFIQFSFGTYFILVQSKTLQDLIITTVYYLTFAVLPLSFIGIFLYPYLTQSFGGGPGKLITGLQVLDDKNNLLTYKRAFFRHTIGYSFSALLFGLGYFAIIKDPEKKGWHDKAVGSRVVVVQNLWPLALVTLVILVAVNFYLIYQGYTSFKASSLGTQLNIIE